MGTAVNQSHACAFVDVETIIYEVSMSTYKQTDWDSVPLGTKPDTVLARELGVSTHAVRGARSKRGIRAFSGSGYTYEGVPCRSALEAMYDAYLHSYGVEHDHEVIVPGTSYRADVRLADGTYVEIVGMIDFGKYKQKWLKKAEAYEKANLSVKVLTAQDVEDLYRRATLPALFAKKQERLCPQCGEVAALFTKGVCRHCYATTVLEKPTKTGVCSGCGQTFFYRSYDHTNKYCSIECYLSKKRVRWPSDEWLTQELLSRTQRDISAELGVHPATLNSYLRSRGLTKKGESREKPIHRS